MTCRPKKRPSAWWRWPRRRAPCLVPEAEYQIGARPDAPDPHRSAEIVDDALAAVHGVHIEAAAQAHGGVEQHPAYGIDEIDAVALCEAVESRPDVPHIVEHVVYEIGRASCRDRVCRYV